MRLNYHSIRYLALVLCAGFICLSAPSMAEEYVNEALLDKSDPAYWLDQGGLFATYGNYPAAVRAYQKALEIDPQNPEAYFDLGVAYGGMDDTDQALLYINKAIVMNSAQERYYYGRAWILLMDGQREQAFQDIQKAADMGDLDAILYLVQASAGIQWASFPSHLTLHPIGLVSGTLKGTPAKCSSRTLSRSLTVILLVSRGVSTPRPV